MEKKVTTATEASLTVGGSVCSPPVMDVTTNQQHSSPKEDLVIATNKKKTADNAQSSLEPQSGQQGKTKKGKRERKATCISSGETLAIFTYTTQAYKYINADLRFGCLSYSTKKVVRKMISGIQKLEPFDGCVWRGMTSKNVFGCKLEVGETFSDKAFLSASTKKSVATDLTFLASGGVVFEIRHHSGKEITSLSNEGEKECEVLFLPNTKFVIDGVEEGLAFGNKTDITYVWLTEVGNNYKKEAKKDGDSGQVKDSQPKSNDFDEEFPNASTETIGNSDQAKDSQTKSNDFDEELPNASSENDLHEKEKENKDDDENAMSPENTIAYEGVTSPVPQKDGQPSVVPNSFNELGSQWINGCRKSARLQPTLGSVYVNGLRRSSRLIK
jgi:hypothetical protein